MYRLVYLFIIVYLYKPLLYWQYIYILSYSNIVQSRNDLFRYNSRFRYRTKVSSKSQQIDPRYSPRSLRLVFFTQSLGWRGEGYRGSRKLILWWFPQHLSVSPKDPWRIHGTKGILIYMIFVDFYGINVGPNVGTAIIYHTWMLFMIRVFFWEGECHGVFPRLGI